MEVSRGVAILGRADLIRGARETVEGVTSDRGLYLAERGSKGKVRLSGQCHETDLRGQALPANPI